MRLFITRPIPLLYQQKLAKHYQVGLNKTKRILKKRELQKKIQSADALLCMIDDVIDKATIKTAKRLQVIANLNKDINNINMDFATSRNVLVLHTPLPEIAEAVAEHALALLLILVKKILPAHQFVKNKKYLGWGSQLFLNDKLQGKTLGIIGLGDIGNAFAQKASCLGLKIIYFDQETKGFAKKIGWEKVSLKNLLQKSDVVSVHLPLNKKTKYFLGSREFALMKEGSFFINTSRSKIVDDKALASACRKKKIAGAALDVWEKEPYLSKYLSSLPHVIFTPHMGSATKEARGKMLQTLVDDLIRFVQRKTPVNVANPQVLKLQKLI